MKGDFGIINENEEINAEDSKPKEEDDPKVEYNRERRKSSYCLAKLGFNNTSENDFKLLIIILAPPPPDPVEGTWKLIQCENYEKYLEKIGTGPLSLNMVMRANVVLTITQVREVFFQK